MTTQDYIQTLRIDGVELQYADSGSGEPLLLVHAGVFADWFVPLANSTALDGFRIIRVRRAGYGTVAPSTPVSLHHHAQHLARLLGALNIEKAHVIGHSSGALISLQFASEAPEKVQSLALIEPAPLGPFQVPAFATLGERFIGPAMAAVAAGDIGAGIDHFLRGVGGEHYRKVLDRSLGPNALEDLHTEARYFFRDEVPACGQWQFTPEDALRVQQPILIVEGAAGRQEGPLSQQVTQAAQCLFPSAEVAFISGANHLVPLQEPEALGYALATFARRHPIGVA